MSEYSIVEFQKISSFETCTYFVQNYIFHSRMKLFEEINLTNKTRTNKNYIKKKKEKLRSITKREEIKGRRD